MAAFKVINSIGKRNLILLFGWYNQSRWYF